jgi:hypothetical protein
MDFEIYVHDSVGISTHTPLGISLTAAPSLSGMYVRGIASGECHRRARRENKNCRTLWVLGIVPNLRISWFYLWERSEQYALNSQGIPIAKIDFQGYASARHGNRTSLHLPKTGF